MFKIDIIKTYIFEPNYYENKNQDIYQDCLKIFNNNILYLYIAINNNICYKTKKNKKNYIIFSYLNYYNTNNEIDINNFYFKINNYDFDIKITIYAIIKKIDKKYIYC